MWRQPNYAVVPHCCRIRKPTRHSSRCEIETCWKNTWRVSSLVSLLRVAHASTRKVYRRQTAGKAAEIHTSAKPSPQSGSWQRNKGIEGGWVQLWIEMCEARRGWVWFSARAFLWWICKVSQTWCGQGGVLQVLCFLFWSKELHPNQIGVFEELSNRLVGVCVHACVCALHIPASGIGSRNPHNPLFSDAVYC